MKSLVNMNDIQRLAFDAYNGINRDGITTQQLNDAVRKAIIDACGGEFTFRSFRKNKEEVFALIEDIMPTTMHAHLAGKFEEFAEIKDTEVGDDVVFRVHSNDIYPIATVARGNQDIERNRIVDRNFRVPTQTKGIKFYEELDWFLSGRMDLARLVEAASVSMANYVGELISSTIYNSYDAIADEYKSTGSFDATTMNEKIEHVKAKNNVSKVQIFGTSMALANIVDEFGYSDAAKDQANAWGYYGSFRGHAKIALPQSYTAGTKSFHVDNNHVIILPAGEKIVKVLFEGRPFMNMTEPTDRNDLQTEVLFLRRIGAASITVPEGKYGFYKFS